MLLPKLQEGRAPVHFQVARPPRFTTPIGPFIGRGAEEGRISIAVVLTQAA